MYPSKTLHMMVGLPRSGKSTRARELHKEHGWPIVCPDSIRLALHGQAYRQETEPMVWAVAKTMVRSLFGAGHDGVILDATNTTGHRRREWTREEWDYKYHCIKTPMEECLQRPGGKELEPVIKRMNKQLTWPE